MQLKKITYGFLILALGMMLTDCYRLMHATSVASFSAANSAEQRRF